MLNLVINTYLMHAIKRFLAKNELKLTEWLMAYSHKLGFGDCFVEL